MGANLLAVMICRGASLPSGAADAFEAAGGVGLVVGVGAHEAASHLGSGTVQVAEAPVRFGHLTKALASVPSVISARMVILPASPDGRDLAPSLAAVLGRPLITGVTRIKANDDGSMKVVAVRTDGLVDHLHRVTVPCVVTLLPGTGHAAVGRAASEDAAPQLVPLELAPLPDTAGSSDNSNGVESIAVLPPDPATMDLTEARCIVAGGNGLVSGAAGGTARFDILREVGTRIGASLGGTRVASDAGWIPFERQIGTTGVEVSPRVYLAFGISGATQHTSGLGSPDHILAVNTDPSCPMMAMSEVAIVADAFAVVQSLHRLLTTGPEQVGTQ